MNSVVHVSFSILLEVYPCFSFKNYAGPSTFPFRELDVGLLPCRRSVQQTISYSFVLLLWCRYSHFCGMTDVQDRFSNSPVLFMRLYCPSQLQILKDTVSCGLRPLIFQVCLLTLHLSVPLVSGACQLCLCVGYPVVILSNSLSLSDWPCVLLPVVWLHTHLYLVSQGTGIWERT
jgi:hypothetical protein